MHIPPPHTPESQVQRWWKRHVLVTNLVTWGIFALVALLWSFLPSSMPLPRNGWELALRLWVALFAGHAGGVLAQRRLERLAREMAQRRRAEEWRREFEQNPGGTIQD